MLHTALNDCILRAKKLETDKLLAGTLDLFASHTTTLSMFDMLHNLRQIDDSTYAHSVNVAIISRMLGNWLGFSEDAQNTLTLCGLFTRYREIPDSCQHHRQAGQADFRRV